MLWFVSLCRCDGLFDICVLRVASNFKARLQFNVTPGPAGFRFSHTCALVIPGELLPFLDQAGPGLLLVLNAAGNIRLKVDPGLCPRAATWPGVERRHRV